MDSPANPAETSRSRSVTWEDPAPVVRRAAHMAGLDVMRAIAAGELPPPPIASLMNFAVTDVQAGRVTFSCTPGEEHSNPLGTIHGGLVCTLLDTAAGCAAHTTLDAAGRPVASATSSLLVIHPDQASRRPS